MTPDQVWTRRTRARHPSHLRPVQGRPCRSASRDSWSRHAALDGDRPTCEPRSFQAGSGKDSGRPGSLVGSRHTGRGSGRRADLHLHPCQPPVRPHSPRPIPGVSPAACAMRRRSQRARGCATGVAAVTPKMRTAPRKGARQERTDHRYFGVPAGRPSGPITGDPFRRLQTSMRVVSAALKGAERRLTWLDQCSGEGRKCSMTSIEIRGARTHHLKNIDVDVPKHRLVASPA